MTIDRDELRLCPFCGRTDLLGFEPHPESHFVGVRCRACGCIGPSKLSLEERESAAHWNRRAVDDPHAEIQRLTLRLQIATELNVGDRKRSAELEAGLREAIGLVESHYEDQRTSSEPLECPYTRLLRAMLPEGT